MSDLKTYEGGCHCGKVRFSAKVDLSGEVISCNCSICSKTGSLLTFVGADQFTLHSGADALTDYQFGKKTIHHPFCRICGVRAFGHGTAPDGRKMYAINVRSLDGVDLNALKLKPFDGKSL